ncbi:hypothetical protein [Rhodoligotrophos defluvii]|uniref:hypothetical protein n=1 Tax=Rhodoligotrophos defluvii TaxID=2561934 RepID=UPI0010C9F01B|nr:hypothetical protein [Rhodoligotrophos defluvii]
MTTLLVTIAGFFFAYAIYIASLSARAAHRSEDYLDAGLAIPPWGYIFAGTGVVLAGLNLYDHLLLTAAYGLQYSHVAVGLILVALCGALVQKRVWLAARIMGQRTIGDLIGDYYGSVALRIYLLVILFLFAVPFSAYCLAEIGALVESVTAVPASLTVWVVAFFLFLHAVIGGWRAVIYVAAGLALLVLALLLFTGGFVSLVFEPIAFTAQGIATTDGVLPDRIPGVMQFSAGIGKEAAAGGIWTTVAIVSFALGLIGIVLSPGFAFLGITTAAKRAFAFNQVWMVGGLAAGLLLLVAPTIAAEMNASDPRGLAGLAARLASLDQLVAACFVMMLLGALQLGIVFFAASGANIVTIELIGRYVLPELSPAGRKLAARIALAAIFAAVALIATFTPLSAAIFSSLALNLSAQLLPAFLGLCWVSWISRSAVLAGLVIGTLLVVFTEPFGLIIFEALFVDLPWGRWPLTVHSAAWGLVFNVAICLLVALFTRGGEERAQRQRLHDEFSRCYRADFGGRAARGAKWSLTLIWAFLALGPGAILGNAFFSQPMFAGGDVALGMPSLLAWQLVFWLVGVLLVWWLAYHGRLSIIDLVPAKANLSRPPKNPLFEPLTPGWIARLLGRLAERPSSARPSREPGRTTWKRPA